MSPTQDSPDKKAGRQRSNQLGKHQGQDEPSDLVTVPRMPNRKTDIRYFPKNRIDDNLDQTYKNKHGKIYAQGMLI